MRPWFFALALGLSAISGSGGLHVAHAVSSGESQRRLREAWDLLDSARTFLARGDDKRAQKRLGEAERTYRDLLRIPEASREAALGLSAVLFLQRRYTEGVALMRPLRERFPDNPDVAHQLGLHLYRSGEQELAVPLLESVAADPKRFDACWILVQHYYRLSRWAEGLRHAEHYLSVRSDDLEALSLIGSYYLKVERFAEAIAVFNRYLERFPDNVAVLVNRANALFRQGDVDAAGREYETLLLKEPNRSRFLYNLATVRMKQRRHEDALALFDRFLAVEPRHAGAIYFRADCLFLLARYDDAQRAFEEARAIDDKNPWTWHGLSRVAARTSDLPRALELARRALELAVDEADLIAWHGTLLRRIGRPTEALASHDKALSLAPQKAPIVAERARDLWALERFPECLEAFEQALKLDPSTDGVLIGLAASRTALGLGAWREGRVPEAESHFMVALEAAADYTPARANLAILRVGARRLNEAALVLEVASDAPDIEAARALLTFEQKAPASTVRVHLERARAGTLGALLARIEGHLAAREGQWSEALRAFEDAQRLSPAPELEQAILQSLFELGLDALGRGDVGLARESFRRLGKGASRLVPEDRHTLEFASAVLNVIGSDKPDAAARTLAAQLQTPRYGTPAAARMRDIGYGYVAWAWLRGQRVLEARKALDKVKDRKSLGAALDGLLVAIDDTEARLAYAARDFTTAARLWSELAAREPRQDAHTHNLAAARFMLGQADAEVTWKQLIDVRSPVNEALYNLGNALGRRGDYRLAFELFVRAGKTGGAEAPLARERAGILSRLFDFGATP